MEIEQQALSIIESYCERSFTNRPTKERIHLKGNVGRLTHSPILLIDSAKARCSEWEHSNVFGASEWCSIDPDEVIIDKNYIIIPGGILNTNFNEAEVEYTFGYAKLPEEIKQACDLLIRKLESKDIRSAYSLSASISPEIAHLLSNYRERR